MSGALRPQRPARPGNRTRWPLPALGLGLALGALPALAQPTARTAPASPDEATQITSDTLRVKPGSGGREIHFQGNVVIEQGALRLRADEARAFYPGGPDGDGQNRDNPKGVGARSPSALSAQGQVQIRLGARHAACARAEFDRDADLVVCHGAPARLERGCDRVQGQRIRFAPQRGDMSATGEVKLQRRPKCEDGKNP